MRFYARAAGQFGRDNLSVCCIIRELVGAVRDPSGVSMAPVDRAHKLYDLCARSPSAVACQAWRVWPAPCSSSTGRPCRRTRRQRVCCRRRRRTSRWRAWGAGSWALVMKILPSGCGRLIARARDGDRIRPIGLGGVSLYLEVLGRRLSPALETLFVLVSARPSLRVLSPALLDRRDMDETSLPPPSCGCMKSVSLLRIEPLHRAKCHYRSPLLTFYDSLANA